MDGKAGSHDTEFVWERRQRYRAMQPVRLGESAPGAHSARYRELEAQLYPVRGVGVDRAAPEGRRRMNGIRGVFGRGTENGEQR